MALKFSIPIFLFLLSLFLPVGGRADPVTPYDLYLFNFGDCVASCTDQNRSRKVCEWRCWQIWKFFLQPRYQLINGVLVEVKKGPKK